MLLKEDGHLDIERVEQLNEEQLREEMKTWGNNELLAWERSKGTMTIDEFFDDIYQEIEELWSK